MRARALDDKTNESKISFPDNNQDDSSKSQPTSDNIRSILDQMNQAFEEERALRY